MIRKRRGMLSLEYAMLIAVVTVALLSMVSYLGRSISGKWRDVGDSFGFGRQYEDATPTFNIPTITFDWDFSWNFDGWGGSMGAII